ncbi:hypothetical protein FHX41_3929 [Actinomadura hallensis]|uniref:Uncharacterized protein n=1 Tax=Actinomadura hallensis TaxID=337895 RepID=A0A543IHZ4_9ACTN|nr:hypothetical protein [Actinomadura hallensis]TQM70209.1 hypothetical protein FHX41_3929 [Actinomadura hallensis]HLV75126.1 hypothetical protein [Vulgatibacteraceae bacterium]
MTGYAVAVSLSCLVGVAELVSRYRDRPTTLVRVPSTWAYVLINGAAGAGSLLLLHTFDWRFGVQSADVAAATQVLVASLGSMMVFRSAVFTVRVGDEDVAVGPSTLLTALLAAADRGVDRMQAKTRAQEAGEIMRGVSFAKAKLALPTYCLGLLQNVSAEDQADLRTAVDALAGSEMTDGQMALNLGLLLMNVAGPDVLRSAVETLREEIMVDGGAAPPVPPPRDGRALERGTGRARVDPARSDPD